MFLLGQLQNCAQVGRKYFNGYYKRIFYWPLFLRNFIEKRNCCIFSKKASMYCIKVLIQYQFHTTKELDNLEIYKCILSLDLVYFYTFIIYLSICIYQPSIKGSDANRLMNTCWYSTIHYNALDYAQVSKHYGYYSRYSRYLVCTCKWSIPLSPDQPELQLIKTSQQVS